MGKRLKLVLILLLVLSSVVLVTAQSWLVHPKPATNTVVFDYAGMVSEDDIQEMQSVSKIIEENTKAQIVVVTVEKLLGVEIEEYALGLFREWGIGDKELNNGLLILANKENIVKNKQGRIRIEVGYGLEGAINDGKAGAILDKYAMTAFETGDYSKGLKDTFMAVAYEVAKEYDLNIEDSEMSSLQNYLVDTDDDVSWLAVLLVIVGVLVLGILLLSIISGYGSDSYGGFLGSGSGGGSSSGGFGGGSCGGGGASR